MLLSTEQNYEDGGAFDKTKVADGPLQLITIDVDEVARKLNTDYPQMDYDEDAAARAASQSTE